MTFFASRWWARALSSCLLGIAALTSGCPASGPDSVEKGCRTHTDCYAPGEPERWCQRETGICLAFTSPPGDTTERDAQVPPTDAANP